jgi:hypothetical protein
MISPPITSWSPRVIKSYLVSLSMVKRVDRANGSKLPLFVATLSLASRSEYQQVKYLENNFYRHLQPCNSSLDNVQLDYGRDRRCLRVSLC